MRYLFIVMMLLAASCTKDYNIVLPEAADKLVVECYLEDGMPVRALISETAPLLDTSIIPPVFVNAIVTITHRGVVDTLRPFVYVDTLRRRAYNYGGARAIVADYSSREPYNIDVWDDKGRHARGSTFFMPRVPITSITPTFNDEGKAYSVTRFPDERDVKNYYRVVLTRNSRTDSVEQDFLIDESFVNSSGDVVFGSGYDYKSGDSIHATLFHLTPEYYNYLNTSRNARSALVNPFAVSGEVVSNIRGGLGVFAALSVTKKSVRVP